MAGTRISKTVVKEDPVFRGSRAYEGYPLALVLHKLEPKVSQSAWIRFVCRDGYAPEIPLKKVFSGSPFLATRSLKQAARDGWEPIVEGGKPVSPGPAYLVWTGPNERPEEFPWPYQIVAIEVFQGPPESIKVASGTDEIASHGFQVFSTRCLKCHSLNGYGGVMGPELISPCSVTQYWNGELLEAYIRKPQSVRANAKMPSNEDLSSSDLASIVAYLKYLTDREGSSSSHHCPAP